jgi:hypothetical protein
MQGFPGLAGDATFGKTSDSSPNYNCIAFAAEDVSQWWWPPIPYALTRSGQFWPPWAPSEESVPAFSAAFVGLGYSICADPTHRPGFTKIAIYVNQKTGRPTHCAIQQKDGTWKSKLGEFIDVSHSTPSELEGDRYGEVVLFMERADRPSSVGGIRRPALLYASIRRCAATVAQRIRRASLR